jgi:hypothetical protein
MSPVRQSANLRGTETDGIYNDLAD